MASSSAFFKKGIVVIWALLLGGHAQTYNFEDQHIQTGFQPIWYPPHAVSYIALIYSLLTVYEYEYCKYQLPAILFLTFCL